MATWLSLGSAADVDPSEGSYNSENASDLLGTYSSAALSTVAAVGNDANRDGISSNNNQGANTDTVSIDGTPMSLDSTIKFSATITRGGWHDLQHRCGRHSDDQW